MKHIRFYHPVPLLLLALLSLTLGGLPFLTYAANRLVAGEPIMLWQLTHGPGLLLPLALLWLLVWRPPRPATFLLLLLLAELLLAGMVFLSGHHAAALAAEGSRLARTAFGSGLWLSAALCLLLAAEAIRHLTPHPLWRLLLNAQVWLLPLLMLLSGQLDQLSLLKEYASRQQVFDQAFARHLALLVGTLLTALLIGMPLGIWLCRRPGWQSATFGVLNVIQTVPSVALFGLLIAPLAGLVQRFPALGDWGIGGIGAAPALIALVLYALLPLVRSVVAGLQQVPAGGRETARGMGMGPLQQFWHAEGPLALPGWLAGLRVVVVQTLGMTVIAALIGAGGFGAIIFQGLLSSALDLVLLGVIPVIALAVVLDALFRLVISLLEVTNR
ncbi:ABC transporter permease [[Erwinia] mediterraneensis]|uniref:ABC transporter permease n=1 Tax=[Erwinia] mediterraneensis TaxID=2161819 RepID=UPI001031C4B9|nr:ABC transporter permease [[Erwinia] mediterraneensis]